MFAMQVRFYSTYTPEQKIEASCRCVMMTSRTLSIISFTIPSDIKDGALDNQITLFIRASAASSFTTTGTLKAC